MRTNGRSIVCQVSAVCGAHFDEIAARAGHNIGHTERTADLDQLATGNKNLLPQRQTVEHKQNRGRVVVHNGGGFGAGLVPDHSFQMIVARAATSRFQIVFQVRRAARRFGHRCHSRLGQRRSTEVGVDNDAG